MALGLLARIGGTVASKIGLGNFAAKEITTIAGKQILGSHAIGAATVAAGYHVLKHATSPQGVGR